MEKNKRKEIIDLEIVDELKDSGVSMIALVDYPAIEKDWMAFKKEVFVMPSKGEHEDEFIPRCIAKLVGEEGYEQDQAAAICYSTWREEHAKSQPFEMNDAFLWPDFSKEEFAKVSIDYDDTLSTGAGLRLAKSLKEQGADLYIISARSKPSKGMMARAEELGIPASKVYTTGSNEAKVAKVKELGIAKHVDNNADVIKELGSLGQKFSFAAETYTDYPEGAVNNAKRALAWADKNGWGDCGMGAGKARANQLANREPISEDTIARMSAFERHRQNSDTPYSEGCGKLMWDAWGGDAGIRWAHNKLREIRGEDFSYDTSALPAYTDQITKDKKVKMQEVNPVDHISLDIPLFLRLLEIARENLNTDDQLHGLVEKAAELSSEGKVLTMDDLQTITSNLPMEMQEVPAPAFPTTESPEPADSPIEKLGYPSMVSLPRGHTIVIMAEGDTPPHGLLVQLMETGGYDVKYWWNNTRNVVPSQVNIDGAQVADEAMSVHLGYHGSMPYGQAFAAVEDLKVGDAVSWKTGGQNPRGKIREIVRNGKRHIPGSDFMLEGTKEDPGYVIELYEKVDGKWKPTGTMVGRKSGSIVKNVELWRQVFASEDQRIIVGPVAIPDKEIVRKYDEGPDKGKPYWVKFSPEVIKKMAEKFMRENRNNDTNLMHDPRENANSYVMESWLVENPEDKANTVYGMDLPVGTWVVKMRVTDPNIWKMVKAGKLNGFSLEGNFMDAKDYEAYQKDKDLYNKVMKILKSV